MTNRGGNYDPFSYGEVRLEPGTNDRPAAADAPEDLLFASSPKKAANDPGWEPIAPDPELLSGFDGNRQSGNAPAYGGGVDFGRDVLNEKGSAAALPAVKPKPRSSSHDFGQLGSEPPAAREPVAAPEPLAAVIAYAPAVDANRPAAPIVKEKIIGALPAQRLTVGPRPSGSLVLPVLVLAFGLAGGGWFWLVQHNAILGGFAAAIGVVGAAFAWIHVRR